MTERSLVIGIGGRGTLVVEILTDALADARVLCIDSDPSLLKAHVPDHTDRLLLNARRSPSRNLDHAKRIYDAERDNVRNRIRSHLDHLMTTRDGPVPVVLLSSPRGGISNAFTFNIASFLEEEFGAAVSISLIAVVPTFNNDYVDVVTFNAGVYLRRLDEYLAARTVLTAILVSEDEIINAERPDDERRHRADLRFALVQVLAQLPRAESPADLTGLGTVATFATADGADTPGAHEWAAFRNPWPFARGGTILAPESGHSIARDLRGTWTTCAVTTLPEDRAVAWIALPDHPALDRFKEAHALSKMTCWKLEGIPCPLPIAHSSQKVFVAMPFAPGFDDIYEHGIARAARDSGLEPWRADDHMSNIDVMCKICKNMQESEFAVVDITDERPSVMFELGLVFGRGKQTMVIQREGENTATDLQGLELIRYTSSKQVYAGLSTFFEQAKT